MRVLPVPLPAASSVAVSAAAEMRWRFCEAQASGAVPPGSVARLARGFNLTGRVDADPPPTTRPDMAVIRTLRERRTRRARLPLEGKRPMSAFGSSAEASDRLARLDAALDADAAANGTRAAHRID